MPTRSGPAEQRRRREEQEHKERALRKRAKPQPKARRRTNPPPEPTIDYLSFVERAVQRTSERLPGIVAAPMLMLMTLRRSTNAIFYDMHVKLTRESAISSAAALTLLLVLSASGPLEMREVVRLSGMSRAAVSALADSLVKQKLLRRAPRPEDRRVVLLEMTGAGHELFDTAFRVFNKRERFWAEALTADEQASLVALLRKMLLARWNDPSVDRRS
jgi:DNA-binding MarR family transcriptional regulator